MGRGEAWRSERALTNRGASSDDAAAAFTRVYRALCVREPMYGPANFRARPGACGHHHQTRTFSSTPSLASVSFLGVSLVTGLPSSSVFG